MICHHLAIKQYKKKIIVYYKEDKIKGVVLSVIKDIDDKNLKNINKKLVGKSMIEWIDENEKCFEIQKKIDKPVEERLIITEADLEQINKDIKIENIIYEENSKEIIVDYKENNKTKRFVFSVLKGLSETQRRYIADNVNISFDSLKNWILDNSVLEKISENCERFRKKQKRR